MSEIAVITPPDFLYNDSLSILLICPSDSTKITVNNILLETQVPLNVMVFETPVDGYPDIKWLLNAVKIADTVFLDLDNCDLETRKFASLIMAQSKTFYLTSDEVTPYNLINQSRAYDFTWLETLIKRGKDA